MKGKQRVSKITWACIQPLTGGMYLGTKNAMGTMPEYVISYKGLDEYSFKKDWCDADGVFTGSEDDYEEGIQTCANEFNLFQYLKKTKQLPPYFNITNRAMFEKLSEDDSDLNVTIEKDPYFGTKDKIDDLHVDFVVAVPVCSGLSNATTTHDKEELDTRNNNMKWITKFVLAKVQPKCYIFENAPGLYGTRGAPVRKIIEDMALKYGYSVTYYKTDTQLHDNTQFRPRTFCILWKWQNGKEQNPPKLNYENKHIDVAEFFARVNKSAPQQRAPEMSVHTRAIMLYLKDKAKKEGKTNWREYISSTDTGMHFIIASGLGNDFKDFVTKSNDFDEKQTAQVIRGVNHAQEKFDAGSWIFDTSLKVGRKDRLPTIFHKNTQCYIHPTEDRLLTIREMLTAMGMPDDYIMYGNNGDIIHKIGQNVPVRTAQWIASEAKRVLDDWDNLRGKSRQIGFVKTVNNVEFFDNTKGEKEDEDCD